jgi:hypothetical protein
MTLYANLFAHQGADFRTTIRLKDKFTDPVDLAGYTVKGQIRRTYTSSTAYDFDIDMTDSESGVLLVTLRGSTSVNMKSGRYVYDIYAKSDLGDDTFKVQEGTLELSPRVTQSLDVEDEES